ncbi:MAG TPA: DUF3300 domain-containing protein [Candidatus Eisenbacteria bacterium]|nr:DUF3300 domain-containing protein [Candidatus Eisenbacteria bacterium]
MRTPGWQRLVARTVLVTFTTCLVACGGGQAEAPATTTTLAQAPTTIPPPPTTLPAPPPPPPPAPPPTLPAQAPEKLGKQELRDLVAPVALYPDVVLASLLPATTNPNQVHEAAQWVGQAQTVDNVPEDRGWDGSVVGLLQFPDVVRWLDNNPAWTDQMGQAVTYQQADVLNAIQDYRREVQNVGNLKSNQYQSVRTVGDDIRIEPAQPTVVYVPSYDPALAVQPQPVQPAYGVNPWIAFGGGVLVGALGAWALYSIFDDDDHDHYYYGGRGIRRYNNYYYNRGRRPGTVDWQPRPYPYRGRPQGWQHTQRLQYSQQPGRKGGALRPPMNAPGTQAPRPAEVRREMRQERQQQQLENRQQRQQQKLENQQQRREQKQENRQQRQTQQQERRQQQQQHQQEQQQRRQEQRQQQQDQRQQRQQQQQQWRQEQRQQQQQLQQQRQERRQEQHQQEQQQRQQRQQMQQEQRQERQQQGGGGGQGGGGQGQQQNKKKKQQQQN